jgi:tRNA pseudouridine38-40 synthase
LDVEYDGTGFHGWAIQPDLRTIEGTMRRALDALELGPYWLGVAGRTDAGVHASAQVVSVSSQSEITPWRMLRRLNGLLSADVRVRGASEAAPGFDARRDARSRTYEYRLLLGQSSPLRRARTLWVAQPLDRERLAAATTTLLGRHDFRSFTPVETQHRVFERTLIRAEWVERDDELVFVVEADSFLRHMVRTMVGALLLLASEAGSYMTGQVLAVDGGMSSSIGQSPYPEELYGLHSMIMPDGLGDRIIPTQG